MKIRIDDVKKALDIVLEQFVILYGNAIEIETDSYWEVMPPEKYILDGDKYIDATLSSLGVGMLSDHLEVIARLAGGDDDCSQSLLVDIGEVLKQCGETELKIRLE